MKIPSKCGKYEIFFDDEYYELIKNFAPNGWEAKFTTFTNRPYAITRKTVLIDDVKVRKQYYMHRLIMNVLDHPHFYVDHSNRNPLDNRKCNLRIVTKRENMKNRSSKKNSASKFLGVSYCHSKKGQKKFRTSIQDMELKKGNIHLGYFEDENSAGYAYNIGAEIIHKEFANLNQIEEKKIMNKEEIKQFVLKRIQTATKK